MSTTTVYETIDADRLQALGEKGRNNPTAVRTVRCRTVAEKRFRHLNYIRTLPAHVVDEPPQLLGDDTAPNPSEAALAGLGTCIAVGVQANAVARGYTLQSLEVELEADINITSVWGTGDVHPKPVGFTEVRLRVHVEAEGATAEELDDLVAYAAKWSPVFNTFQKPVSMKIVRAS